MSLHQLLQIICEDLIPYFSKNSADKSLMRYRVADAKTKSEVRVLSNISFHQPIDNHNNFIYYFGISSIYQINPIQKIHNRNHKLKHNHKHHLFSQSLKHQRLNALEGDQKKTHSRKTESGFPSSME